MPLLLLATLYRNVHGVAGSYLTAHLAPGHPMGHALVLSVIGLSARIAGAVTMWGYGPAWFPSLSSRWPCRLPGRVANSA
jgi:hypothetical protein